MTEEERSQRGSSFGRVLSGIGSLWAVLFVVANFFDVGGTVLGDILGFFGESFFIPIALIFAGRAVTRRSRPRPSPVLTRPEPEQRQRPVETVPPPAQRKVRPQPIVMSSPDIDELEAAIGFDDQSIVSRPGQDNKDQFKARYEPTHRPKSSDEMIAEARDRLKRKPKD